MIWIHFTFFLAIIIGTLTIAYWSAKRAGSAYRFYSASGQLTGFQNGLALAGDFISAASFLGVTGAIALYGYDGGIFAVGFFLSYGLLWLVAGRVRRLGRFTLAEVVCARFPQQSVRAFTALTAIIISVWYMIPQLVAAGLLIHLLLGVNDTVAVLVTGGLMTIYVVFGGMVTTSWIQIIKTTLLLSSVLLLCLIVLSRWHWNVQSGLAMVSHQNPFGNRFFSAGNLFPKSVDRFTVLLSLILGTAGLPHVLVRFFTVRDIRAVRMSIITATSVVGVFYAFSLLLGIASVAIIGWNALMHADVNGNLAVVLLSGRLGGDFLTAFISAVAFATILAVVTGLLLTTTTAISYDVLHSLLQVTMLSEKRQLQSARWTAATVGLIAVFLSLGIRHMNVTLPVTLIFAVSAATNVPLLLFTFYWRRFTATGAVAGLASGLFVSVVLTLYDGHVFGLLVYPIPHLAIFQLSNLGLLAVPSGFLGGVVGSLCSTQSPGEIQRFESLRNPFPDAAGGH